MCDSGRDETLVTVYKLTQEGRGNYLISEGWEPVELELDAAEVGQKFNVEIAQMKRWEIEDLPEFDGF